MHSLGAFLLALSSSSTLDDHVLDIQRSNRNHLDTDL